MSVNTPASRVQKKKYVKVDRPRKEQADYESIIQALY